MSNPISTVTSLSEEPELEVDESLSADSPPPVLEVDPIEATEPSDDAHDPQAGSGSDVPEEQPEPEEQRGRIGLLALILGLLLAGSIAYNLKQSRDVASLEAKGHEFELALTGAVERIDQETARADGLQSKLQGITNAVDTVNGRIASLQVALEELRAATAD